MSKKFIISMLLVAACSAFSPDALSPLTTRLACVQCTDSLECVDDPDSQFYKQIVNRTEPANNSLE